VIGEPARVDDVQTLLAAVVAWGTQRPDVHAILLVGSHARTNQPADRWSDIDLVMVVDNPAPYARSPDWLSVFGQPLLSFLEPTAVGSFVERRVLFATGQEVDFALLPLPAAARLPEQAETAAVFARGFRVMVDKLGLEPALRRGASRPPPRTLPTPAQFTQVTHDFWYHALWAAKKLRRGEVWVAKQSCDGYLKQLLVELLAWHAQATDPHVDTWHGGRFLERWADRHALQALRQTYARYEAADIARALWATVDLFERVERECARRLDLPLGVPHHHIRQRLGEILTFPS
jgi:aminoglycoside 6-adenylyltransferase